MNTRAKGARTLLKAVRYALGFPATRCFIWRQVSRFPQEQPFDLLLLREGHPLLLVEVRTGQWGTAKPNTRDLAALPGCGFLRELWRFLPRSTTPDVRQWRSGSWLPMRSPWEYGCGETGPTLSQRPDLAPGGVGGRARPDRPAQAMLRPHRGRVGAGGPLASTPQAA